jgi:steroid 5-alpha reductase family enzyme
LVFAVRILHKSFFLILSAYLLALIAAVFTGYFFPAVTPLIKILTADIAATLVIYGFGRVFHNASFYDPYWSVAPPVIAICWWLNGSPGSAVLARQMLVMALIFVWAFRLTFNWARQWQGIQHEDWRYRDLRAKYPGLFWLVDLFGIELMPTILVFVGCLPLLPALSAGEHGFSWLDILAAGITVLAIIIETVSDEQMKKFAGQKQGSGEILQKGLWKYSRHPNYFGEVLFWWGMYLFGLAANPDYWWTIAGPVLITLLFLFISIPLMEKRSLKRRPGYAVTQKKISALFPWFPRT